MLAGPGKARHEYLVAAPVRKGIDSLAYYAIWLRVHLINGRGARLMVLAKRKSGLRAQVY